MSNKTKNSIITIMFITILIIVFIINILKADEDISISERRNLTSFPKFSVSKLFNKSFANEFEKYTMDQFILRDDLMSLKTFVELNIFRKKDVNNLYEYNGSIVKQEYPLNEKSILNVVKKINEIQNTYLDSSNNVYYSIIPDKNYFIDDEQLKFDYTRVEKLMAEDLKNIEYINILETLKLEDYYYTDTHWKQENLKDTLDKIATQMEFKERIKTDFIEKEISNFQGVYTGQLQVKTKKDSIKVLSNEIIENAKVYNFETKKYTSIYDLEKINSADKYDIYLSGATALLTIENELATTNDELIVFRDSFGSSIIPLFTEAYKKITVIDTRYISPKILKEYVDFENSDVLFLYSTLVLNSSWILK